MMNRIKRIFMIELGTFLFAFAIGMFILPGNILSGGVAGITNLISGVVPVQRDVLVVIINTLLFIIGSIFLGKEFLMNTLIYSISYPIFLLLITRNIPVVQIDTLLAAVYGGIIAGIGVGIMFRNGGSSGGTDAIALIIEKYFNIKPSKTIMIMDAITVLAGLYIYGLNSVLIGLISVFLLSMALDRTMNIYTGIGAKKFEIISDKYEVIADEIHNVVERGTTVLDVTGGYTGDKKKMLVVVVSDDQYQAVKSIIDKNDPNAFVVISETKEINGEGFTYEVRM